MENSTKYIDDVLYNIKGVLTNPESALFLRELYDESYNSAKQTNVEMVLGPVLKRKTESVEDFSMLGYYTKEYKRYDIKKFFGLTIAEYLDSTSFFKRNLIREARVIMNELDNELNKIKHQNKHTLDGIEDMLE